VVAATEMDDEDDIIGDDMDEDEIAKGYAPRCTWHEDPYAVRNGRASVPSHPSPATVAEPPSRERQYAQRGYDMPPSGRAPPPQRKIEWP
jgi:hypothetical protein